jgi:hypothetical protein
MGEITIRQPLGRSSCPSQRHAFSAGERLRHEHRSISFRSSIGLGQKSLHQKSVAVLHQYMSQVAQLRLAAFGLLEQPGIGIRRRWVWFFRFSP